MKATPRHKSVPRVRATPRQIRDIKPKRQLPLSQRIEDEAWWDEADETNGASASSGTSNYLDGDTNDVLGSAQESSSDNGQGRWKQCQTDCREWYQRTSRTKKLKQFFWTFILYRALKLIYAIDFEEYSPYSGSTSAYYSPSSVEMKPLGKSFLTDDLYSPKASSLGGYGHYTQTKNGLRVTSLQTRINEPYYSMTSHPISSKSMPNSGAYQRLKNIIHSLFSSDKKMEVQASQPLQSLESIASRRSYNNFQ